MNINSIRKNYSQLTMLERLALADNALGRNDDAEALAIKRASPRVSYTQTDFCELLGEIVRIRVCNLVARLGYIMTFDLFLHSETEAELEKLINKSQSTRRRDVLSEMRLAGYLYVRATGSWDAINNELGLRTNFDEEMSHYFPALDLLQSKGTVVRDYAFSEKEAIAYVHKKTGSEEFMTIAQEIESYREMLKLKELY